jgi:putative membrane protein
MNVPLTLLAALALAVSLGGCQRQAAEEAAATAPADATEAASTPAPVAPAAPAPLAEADALALVAAIDQHEIDAAALAQAQAARPGIKDYATMLAHDHETNLQATRALQGVVGPPADATLVATHQAQAETERARLQPLTGADFDTAFLDVMARGHAAALAMLDERAIPGARDPGVRAHFEKTREAVANHLEQVQALQVGE